VGVSKGKVGPPEPKYLRKLALVKEEN